MPRLNRIILITVAILGANFPALAEMTCNPPQPNVEQQATLVVSVSGFGFIDAASVSWTFGDGTFAGGSTLVVKTYNRAGAFRVDCRYFKTFGGQTGVWVDESYQVTVLERRQVTASPAAVQLGQTVTLQALNFLSSSIRWDFGDGSPTQLAGATVSHAYSIPGVLTASARDNGGASAFAFTAVVTVAVDISRRSLLYAPNNPVPLLPTTFTAVNFFTSQIRWNFGDGTPAVSGGTTISHAFARKGAYTIQAWDWNGQYAGPTAVTIQVQEPVGPAAPFQIFFLQLRFADGLSYKVVPRNFSGLTAFADIKYEGTGIFQAQWLVDGMPFRAVSQTLPFADATTMDSGRIPALPTQITGMHEVSLRILSPTSTLTMPVIRYFVSAETGTPPLRGLNLQVATVEGLKGVVSELRLDSLRIPAGTYFILNGSVTYAQAAPIRFALLRIHLGDALADQQILRDLKPAETRSFTTSVFNPTPEGKFIYITLYDISDPNAPKLLYLKKIAIPAND